MPRQGGKTKQRIIDAAYELFYEGGFARASVDAIAGAAGVTKRTFYYHFESKQALMAAVLELQHDLVLERIQRWAGGEAGDPAALVQSLFREFAAWSVQPGWRGSGFTCAAMEFAGSQGHPARLAARGHKASVEGWLADQFQRSGLEASRQLARQVMLLLEGCNALVLIHGDTSYVEAARDAACRLVGSLS